jgi:hypothetical protein
MSFNSKNSGKYIGYSPEYGYKTDTSPIGIWDLTSVRDLKTANNWPPEVVYENLTVTATATVAVTGNGTSSLNMFKTSGIVGWDAQVYCSTPFTAPVTLEFNKQAAAVDNGLSYAMISLNSDPTTDVSFTSLEWASYIFRTDRFQVYNNGLNTNWAGYSTSNKFYIVYKENGYIEHYNGSTLLASFYRGVGQTVYLDSSFYSVDATYAGFSNVRVTKRIYNGTGYI